MSGSNEIRMSFDAKAFEMSEHEHVKEILDNLSNLENEWVLRKIKSKYTSNTILNLGTTVTK